MAQIWTKIQMPFIVSVNYIYIVPIAKGWLRVHCAGLADMTSKNNFLTSLAIKMSEVADRETN